MMIRKSLVVVCLAITACSAVAPSRDREWVDASLRRRLGAGLADEPVIGEASIPDGVELADGIDAREAVALALYNDPGLEALLTELDVSGAQLAEAGLLKNPVLSLLFPVGPKQLEAALTVSIDAIWRRPRRIAVAELDVEAVAEDLVAEGLNLARDTETAFVHTAATGIRVDLARDVETLRRRRAELEERRRRAGDVPQSAVDVQRLEAERAAYRVVEAEGAHSCALVELGRRLGVDLAGLELVLALEDEERADAELPALETLLFLAAASRPEIRAAEIRIEQAAARADLAAGELLALDVIVDANEEGSEGFEAGPGVGLEIPVFDRGQGRDALAHAEMMRAVSRGHAISRQVAVDVERAWWAAKAARLQVDAIRRGILATARAVVEATRRARAAGDVSEVEVVESELARLAERERHIDARVQERVALARLEAAVGHRLPARGDSE